MFCLGCSARFFELIVESSVARPSGCFLVVVVGTYSVVLRWGCFFGSCFCCSIFDSVLWNVFLRSLWAFGV
jgi:hypothetical protein